MDNSLTDVVFDGARKKPPQERASITHKIAIQGHEGYITVGVHEDSTIADLFVHDFGKEGSAINAWINAWAIAISIALQCGATIPMLARKYRTMKFEPYGKTDNPDIPDASSICDYIFAYLELKFDDDGKLRA